MTTDRKRCAMVRGVILAMIVTIAWSATASSVGATSKAPRTGAAMTASVNGPDWLGVVNDYREASGLATVSDDPAWNAGLLAHFAYLSKTPASLFSGPYQSVHTENPASPYYTSAGAEEGGASDLVIGAPETWGPIQYINDWLGAPFHALGILNPTLGRVAFAESGGDGGIDVLRGSNERPRAKRPVLFPGPGMSTDLTTFQSESPSPLQTCNWSEDASHGLPLIAELTTAPENGLTATLDRPGGGVSTSQNGGLCVVDSNDYRTTDTVYGASGAKLLATYHAVFLIPRTPLVNGTYVATIDEPGRESVTWSFHVVAAPSVTTLALAGGSVGTPYVQSLDVVGGALPYTWTLAPHSVLPPGLTLSRSGAIRGIPTQIGVFRFAVYVTDVLGQRSKTSTVLSINVGAG